MRTKGNCRRVLINSPNQTLDQYSINILVETLLTETSSTNGQQSAGSWLLTDCRQRCLWSVNSGVDGMSAAY